MTLRDSERGNVFFALFGAVALVGVIGAATSTLMRGPVSTVMSVNQRTKADTQMQIASKLAMVRAAQQANNGDCDSDGTIEAMLPDAFASGPSGGGALPASIGASQIDPWNTKYGYCVWDLGAMVDDAACGGPGARLSGGNNMSYPVMVIMSAGPDKTFQTTCNDWVDTTPADGVPDNATTLIDKPAGSDDIILSFTYSEAVQAAGGLWSLMSGDPTKITTDKDVAFSSGTNVDFSAGTTANFQGTAQFADNSRLDLGLGGLFLLPDEVALPTCNGANDAALRINKSSSLNVIEMCDPGATALYPTGWVPLGGAGATVAKIDDLSDAVSYPGDDVLFMGQDAGLAYSSSTGAGNNIGIGIGAASALVTGGGNIVLGNNIPLSAGTSDTLRIGQFLSGSNIYSSSGSMTIGGALDVGAGLTVGATAQAARFQVDGTAGFMDSSGTGMILGSGASTVVTIESGGNVGIGVADPNVALDVSGDAQISGDTTSDHFLATAGSAAGPSFSFGSGSGLGMYNAGASALGFATSGINRVTIDNTGLGIGTSPSVALDVAGAGEFTGSVTAGSFQFSSGQGMFPAGAGINLTGGNVGIGQASPATTLDVNGEVRIGGSLSTNCTAGIIGAVRFASGDQLEVCLSTGWAVVGASSGGGSGSGSNWTKLGDNRLYYIQNNVGVMTNDPQADFHVGGNLLATGTFGAGDATPVAGAGTRMMFVPNKGAFRAGYVGGTQWDHATIGNYSAAFGANTTASGNGSAAFGDSSTAGGFASFAAGNLTTANGGGSVALGNEAMVATGADLSMAFGLGDATGAVPRVSGDGSFGIFMGDQSGVDVTANNVMTLLGGSLVIDIDGTSATNLDISRAGMGIDVQGDIGAVNYCDQNGANCFSALDVTSGGVGVWEDASNVIRLTSGTVNYASADFVFGSPQLDDVGDATHDTRVIFDKEKGAFRAGSADGTQWDDANRGIGSTALGYNNTASGAYSFAAGRLNTATSTQSIALGYGANATQDVSVSIGSLTSATAPYAVSIGNKATASGANSFAFGLGDPASNPVVSGARSFGIFMGDQSGVNFASANTMGLFGGKMIIDSAAPATQLTTSGSLSLDVEGDVGAINYCDENGQNCFTAAGVSSGSFAAGNDRELQFNSNGALGADVNLVFTSAGYLGIGTNAPAAPLHTVGDFLNTGTYTGTASAPASGAGTRMFFDTEMSAFRAGSVAGTEWDNGNIGAFSTAIGSGAIASGLRSTAIGYITNALGQDSVALGGPGSTASGENSLALGRYVVAGDGVANSGFGDGSMAIGLISDAYTITTPSQVRGNQSLGIFMGDQDGLVMTDANTMGLFGGKMVIDPKVPATQLAARSVLDLGAATDAVVMPSGDTAQRPASPVNGMLRYNSANGKFEGYQAGVWQDLLTGAATSTFLSLSDTPASYAGAANQYVRVNAATNALEFTDEIIPSVTGQPAPDYMGLNDLLDVDLSVAPTGGQFLQYDSASGLWFAGSASASSVTAAGSDREIQFNSGGNFAASSGLTYTSAGSLWINTPAGTPAALHATNIGGYYAGVFDGSIVVGLDADDYLSGSLNFFGGASVNGNQPIIAKGRFGQISFFISDSTDDESQIYFQQGIGGNSGVIGVDATTQDMRVQSLVGDVNLYSATQIVDISATGALVAPRGTTAQRPASPVNGMLRYNSESGKFEGYQAGVWQDILTGAATSTFLSLTDTPASYAGVANQYVRVNAATNALEFTNEIVRSVAGQPDPDYIDLNDISDVNLTVAPTDGQVLRFDSATGMWVAGSGGGGTFLALTDTPSAYTGAGNKFVRVNAGATALEFIDQIPTISGQPLPSFLVLNDMDDVDLTVAPTGGQFLQYNSASGKWVAGNSAGVVLAINDLTDAKTDYVTDMNLFMGLNAGNAIQATGGNNTIVGINAGSAITIGDFNTAMGSGALNAATDAVENSAFGEWAMHFTTTGSGNVAIGNNALNDNTTGWLNTAVGVGALWTNVAGNETTAIGREAMRYANNTAVGSITYNTAVGAYALRGSTTAADNTGVRNTAIGHGALMAATSGSCNTALGQGALSSTTTGTDNTALGQLSLAANVSGIQNTAVGAGALNLSSANNNVGIGFGAGDNITTGSNNIMIGTNVTAAVATDSNQLNIGDVITGNMATGNIAVNGAAALTVPRGDTSQRPTGVNGMIRYNSQTSKLEAYQAGAWVDMIGGGSSTFLALTDTPASYAASGSKYVRVNSGATALEFTDEIVGTVTGQPAPNFMDLDDLSDVNLSVAPTNGQVLSYNGTSWVAAAAGGGGGTPAGANGEVQFNSNGSFGATPGFAWLNPGILLHTGNVNKTASIIPQAPGDALLSLVANNNGVTSEFVVDSGEGFKMYYHGAEFMRLASSGNLGIGTAAPQAKIHSVTDAASSNTVIETFRMQRSNSGGAGAAGLGAGMNTYLETSTNGTVNLASRFETQVITAAPASFATRMSLYPYYNNLETLGAHFSGTSTGIRLGIGINAPSYDLGFNGGQARSIGVERVLGAAPGVNLTVQAGGTMSGGNNLNGGNLVLNSGIATGNGSSSILFQTVAINQGAGTTDRLPTTAMTLAANALTIPAGSTAERPGQIGMQAAVNGMIRYNSQTAKFEGYQAGVWVDMIGGGGGGGSIDSLSDAITEYASGNMFLGQNSGVSETTAIDNVALGNEALKSVTDGQYNVGIGSYALTTVSTGDFNTAVGYAALKDNTDSFNTAFGYRALRANTSGSANTAMGYMALDANLTGTNNTAIGMFTLSTNVGKQNSTAIGYEAMRYADDAAGASSTYNTAVGAYALRGSTTAANNTGVSNTAVGYSALRENTTGTFNTAAGDDSLRNNTTGGYNTAFGQAAMVGIPGMPLTGSYNSAFGTNALYSIQGAATFNTAVGHDSLRNNTTGSYNTAVGQDAMLGDSGVPLTGSYNSAFGTNALYKIQGAAINNTALGHDSLRYNTTGASNTAVGQSAMLGVSGTPLTGGGNVAMGKDALMTIQGVASNNVAIGMSALKANTTQSGSVAIGFEALMTTATALGNTAVGYQALRLNQTGGIDNTALGYQALDANTTGDYNVALGRETLGANQTGSANLAIGSSALQNVVSASNNVAIGIDALNTTSAGNNTAIGFSAGSNLTTGTGNIMIGYDADAPVAAGSNQLNIGGTIYGDLSQDRIGIGAVPAAGVELDVTGDIQYTGILTDVSDMRLKTDIHPLRDRGSMLEKIGQIDTYSFRMKDDKEGQVEFGVMAQEMQKVFPELVQVDVSSPEKYMSVNYMGMIAPLVAATQELKAENDNLKAQLGSLESKMASIEADMKGMKAHTGYGIGKAGFGMGMAAGLGLMGGLGGVIAFRRRRKAG